jgi:signal peptidase II
MLSLKYTLLTLTLLTSCVGCDQVTKEFARTHLASAPPQSFFHDVFRLQYAENAGAFLSVGTTLPEEIRILMFQALVGTGLIALFIWMLRAQAHSHLFSIALGLILAGGGRNLIDRLLHQGRVIDFMNVGIGPLRTGIFNFADVFITVGGVVLLWISHRPEYPGKETGLE